MNQRSSTKVDKHIGARLRAARIEQAYSQAYIGEQLGISFQQIQKYEKGVNRVCAVRLAEFSEHYQKPMTWFFDGADVEGLRGKPVTDLGAKVLGTSFGRRFVEAYLDIKDADGRAALLHMAETLARRSTRSLQAAE